MPRLNPPFRAEHIGSLLRPPELLRAREAHQAKQLTTAALRGEEDKAIRSVVAMQEEVGLKVVTDGEFRRSKYTESFTTSGLSGVEIEDVQSGWSAKAPPGIPVVTGLIRRQGSTNIESFAFLKSVTKVTPKITLPGPCYIHFRAGRQHIDKGAYPNLSTFWEDLITAYNAEINSLAQAGCRYLQLDETSFAKFGDPKIRESLTARGDPWEALLEHYIDVMNAVLSAAPSDMRIGMHLCRGNSGGGWQASGGYDTVADKVFRKLKLNFYFLEYDSPRAGGFEPLRSMPDDRVVVLGLVSTKTGELEPESLLAERVREASKYISLDRLAISPQCGFASSQRGNPLTIEQEIAKLRRVVDVSRKFWNE
jgi:5-methyltetrahydropteroyltriglutamate--homocysteine methyltransferase